MPSERSKTPSRTTETRNRGLVYRAFGEPAEALAMEPLASGALAPGQLRVEMIAAPINPSDLIPITGAYRHRIAPPRVAGYEGVGRVVEADAGHGHLLGQRVLPLRGEGTWQRYAICDAAKAIAVPDRVPDPIAARAYINPLAAYLMLRGWPVAGRHVLLTAAGSSCAGLLGQWALRQGAVSVRGITDSAQHDARLRSIGVQPVRTGDHAALDAAARHCSVVFDAVGGRLAERLLAAAPADTLFVSYGALSGTAAQGRANAAPQRRFHIRDRLADLDDDVWQGWFQTLWPLLEGTRLPPVRRFPFEQWRAALAAFSRRGRQAKPLLTFGHPEGSRARTSVEQEKG